MSGQPVVSCLCVTRNRVPKLRRAVTCFLRQSYPRRELVVLYESDDAATHDYLAGLAEPTVRALEIPVSPKQTLGALRNMAIQASLGDYIAQWDDDDWHGPERLTQQMQALRQSGQPACVLTRWLMYDEVTGNAYLSGPRAWEGSLLALRAAITPYADVQKGEDTQVVERLAATAQLVGLDSPQLYIYTYHGSNTWGRAHWRKNLLPQAQVLAPQEQQRILRLLASEP